MSAGLLSILAGLATWAGGALVAGLGRPNRWFLGWLLGVAAGVMLGVSAVDLLPAALRLGGVRALGWGAGLVLVFLALVCRWLVPAYGREFDYRRLGYFVGTAVALHDLPEGMAIAVGYAAGPALGLGLAVAIALHNLPEGMVMAGPLLAGGLSRRRVLGLIALVAAVTPLGTGVGELVLMVVPGALAPLLAAAAAVMLFVVLKELLPAARHHPLWAGSTGLVLGLALSLVV
ncbi:MAG: ZIP family metal transporter [Clostridia bacterium]|nr:ZIP family metal transporter [Clostridia bacterium]MDH7571997.1 ZIP family metal transporter [Clostridia bacterium]